MPYHTEVPFWSDDFDMDLPKVIPDARDIVGEFGAMTLWTVGHRTHGRLNHPSVWNGDRAMLAFFGFDGVARPPGFHSDRDPVACSVWEAFRDAWPHSYLMHVERRPIWNTFALRPEFEAIMYQVRKWKMPGRTPDEARVAIETVRASLEQAVKRLTAVCHLHGRIPA